jgi:hypothetical protein
MKKKICSLLIIFMLLLIYFVTFSTSSSESTTDSDWYYLPGYPNYAPSGLPDFSQLQQKDWWGPKYPDFCGAVSLADILWWFDSKHEDPNGKPGDGIDIYPLVQDYNAPGTPQPRPYSDDHGFNNVNDNQTAWHRFKRGGELIERIAWYTNRQKDAFWIKFLGPFGALYSGLKLYLGAKIWLRENGLQNQYSVKCIVKPNFSVINDCVRNNKGVILGLLGYDPEVKPFGVVWGHFVAVAGVNSSGQIALSDPVRDKMIPSIDPAEHNNASIVSHDIFNVSYATPWPSISSWYLPDYCKEGVQVVGAVIISEIK